MSRAFINENAGDPDELPERPVSSSPNYVTPYGLEALRRRAHELKTSLAAESDEKRKRLLARDLKYYEARLAKAILVSGAGRPGDEVRFGAVVEVRCLDGSSRRLSLVGQDEAEEGGEKVAWDSGAALALLGAKPGDAVELPRGEAAETVVVASIVY